MIILDNILLVLLIGLLSGCLTDFLIFCFAPGNIFGKWLPFVAELLLNYTHTMTNEQLDKLNEDLKGCENKERFCVDQILTSYAYAFTPFYKLLGGCGTCMNFYVTMGIAIYMIILFQVSWWLLPLAVFAGHGGYKIISKI